LLRTALGAFVVAAATAAVMAIGFTIATVIDRVLH